MVFEWLGVSLEDVSYIEVYGIGIVIGDVVEVIGIVDMYIWGIINFMWKLKIGFVKLNFNYIEFIVGLVGLIKFVLMIKKKRMVLMVNVCILNFKLKL